MPSTLGPMTMPAASKRTVSGISLLGMSVVIAGAMAAIVTMQKSDTSSASKAALPRGSFGDMTEGDYSSAAYGKMGQLSGATAHLASE